LKCRPRHDILIGGGPSSLQEDANVMYGADKAGLDSGIIGEGSEACRKKGRYSAIIS